MNTIFEEHVDLKKELFKYLSYWKYFLISAIVALLIAYSYIRYTNPLYSIESRIKILEENNKGLKLPSELLGIMGSGSGINLENEVETMKSRRLFGPVVSQLNLTTSYYSEGKFRDTELWNPPLLVTAIIDNDNLFSTFQFGIKIKKNGYLLREKNGKEFFVSGVHVKVKINNVDLLIEPTIFKNKSSDLKELQVVVIPYKIALERLIGKINISNVGKKSEILSIKIQDINTFRGISIVNKIVEVFNQDGINDRRLINKKTVNFIDDRFKKLTFELDSIENQKRDFKRSKDISFIEADAAIDITKKANSDESLFLIETQIELSNLLKEAINKLNYKILPANIGLDNIIINNLITEYNALVLERERLVKTAGTENPVLKLLDSQIQVIKNNINESIYIYGRQLKISLSQQQSDYSKSREMVLEIPTNEKILRSIERQQKIKENLYLLLLQKREESAIAYAVTAPSIKIIEYATASLGPISPKQNITYFVALFLGLVIPFLAIFIINLLDTKIKDINDIVFRKSKIPVIGEIPFFKDFKLFRDKNDLSVDSESFRILSSNVKFSLPIKEFNVGQVILVTSSVMGEGKTFVAANLSLAFASYDKKVLLVGGDMRKPKLHETLEMVKNEHLGLSTYLHEENTSWRKMVVKNNLYNKNLDIIFSGAIPPNPSNLISNGRFKTFIEEAKMEYDYIIVDCTPTIYVNDVFLIAENADLTLYLTRFDYTDKNLIDYTAMLHETGKLKNIAFIFNGIHGTSGYFSHYAYNYGYAYGYQEEQKRSSKRVFLKSSYRFISSFFGNK